MTTDLRKEAEAIYPRQGGSPVTHREVIDAMLEFASLREAAARAEERRLCIAACLSKKVTERQTTLMHNLAVEDCVEAIEQLSSSPPSAKESAK